MARKPAVRKLAGKKPVAMLAREAVQTAEDAREIAVRRREQERMRLEREAAAAREAAAKAKAEEEARLRAEEERLRKEREQAERAVQRVEVVGGLHPLVRGQRLIGRGPA